MRASQKGISLLEILVAIAVISLLAKLVFPLLPFGQNNSERIKSETKKVRFALQQTLDSSWSQGRNIALVRSGTGKWDAWNALNGAWVKQATLYTENPKVHYIVETKNGQLKKVAKAIGFNDRPFLILLSNGEYTPFSITIYSGSGSDKASATITGDGIHEITSKQN